MIRRILRDIFSSDNTGESGARRCDSCGERMKQISRNTWECDNKSAHGPDTSGPPPTCRDCGEEMEKAAPMYGGWVCENRDAHKPY